MGVAPVLARSIKYKLVLSTPGAEDREFVFDNQSKVSVGRASECDIVISTDPKISRNHLEFRIDSGDLKAVNVSGKNYVFLDGRRIEEEVLSEQCEVKIGDTLLKVTQEAPPQPQVQLVSLNQGAAVPVPVVDPTPKKENYSPALKTGGGGIAPPMGPTPQFRTNPKPQRPPPRPQEPLLSGRMRFYVGLVVVGAIGYWFLFSENSKKAPPQEIRRAPEVVEAINKSTEAVKELEKKQELQQSVQYRSAQEHYIKGFRDYRNGQYARAMQSFSAALSFYPNHELARRYYGLAKRKFDEQVQFHMTQGRRYHGKNNFRLCKASFANVIKMLKDPNSTIYKEAKQYYDECSLRMGGRY